MCGIAGIVNLEGGEVDPGSLERMTDALAHRGPEGRGIVIQGNVGLGHRRLKILDLSEAAAQPMISEDGNLALVFNGEIYNFAELRETLVQRGHRFKSSGDTEVLLKLFQEEGVRCTEKLRGMFAFAVHNRKTGEVFLVRDRVGKKPIKYFRNGRIFAFASELKALKLLAECPKTIDEEAVHHFLTMMYLPAPLTGIKGIQKLPAATFLRIDTGTGETGSPQKYWSLKYGADRQKNFSLWREQILSVLNESVRLRMISDVPVGAFLSGGIDSAAVVALMARISPHPVKTFSIGSTAETHNELPLAKLTAERLGTDHHPILVDPDIVKLLPLLVRTYEEPYADPSAIPTYLIAQEAKQEVTVALNGDGGDENFLGYVRYPILSFSLFWQKFPGLVQSLALSLTRLYDRGSKSTLSYRVRRFQESMSYPWPVRYLQYLSFFTDEEKRSLYRKERFDKFVRTDTWYASITADARARAADPINQAAAMDLETYLADDLLPKVDLGTMAHALEARSPLLDHKLLELSATIPRTMKMKGFSTKIVFKKILEGIIPEETLKKPKTGFRLPLDRWFRNELKSFVSDKLLDSSSPLFNMFDRPAIEKFLSDYHATKIDFSDHVWALLWLNEWMRQN